MRTALASVTMIAALGCGATAATPTAARPASLGPLYPFPPEATMPDLPPIGGFVVAVFGGTLSDMDATWGAGGSGSAAIPEPCRRVSATDDELDTFQGATPDEIVAVEGPARPAALQLIERHLGRPVPMPGGWIERTVAGATSTSLFSWGATARICANGALRDRVRAVLAADPRLPGVMGMMAPNVGATGFHFFHPPPNDPSRHILSSSTIRYARDAKLVRAALERQEVFLLPTQQTSCTRLSSPEQASAYEAVQRGKPYNRESRYSRRGADVCSVREY